jgi:hypothetical protein
MKKYSYIVSVVLVFLFSAVFRLAFSNINGFGMDEDSTLCPIFDSVANHRFPSLITKAHGISAINTVNLSLYFLMFFFHDPRLIGLFFNGIPNLLAVVLCFIFCCRFFDKRTALVASALFGFSKWSVFYSMNLWGCNDIQFFSIFVFYILGICLIDPKTWKLILLLCILPFLPGLHLTSLSIILTVPLILFLYRCRYYFRYLWIFLGVFVFLLILNFISKEDFCRKLGLDRNILMYGFNFKAIYSSLDIIAGEWFFYGFIGIYPQYPAIETLCEMFLKILFFFGCANIAKTIIHNLKNRQITGKVIIGIWYFVFVLFFGLTNLPCHLHYFLVVMPALFIIVSVGLFSVSDYLLGKEKMHFLEAFFLFFVSMLWNPCITMAGIFIVLIIVKSRAEISFIKVIMVRAMHVLMVLVLFFLMLSQFQLFFKIQQAGCVPGRGGMDIGSKMDAVKSIIDDARLRYKETGAKSYYSILGDEAYSYLFKYRLLGENEKYLSTDSKECVYHYRIIRTLVDTGMPVEGASYIWHKRFGPLLVIAEKINEK